MLSRSHSGNSEEEGEVGKIRGREVRASMAIYVRVLRQEESQENDRSLPIHSLIKTPSWKIFRQFKVQFPSRDTPSPSLLLPKMASDTRGRLYCSLSNEGQSD